MINVLEGLLDLLLVLGTSLWGWLGVALGFGAAFLSWNLLAESATRGPVSAFAFLAIFVVCAWQELRGGKPK